MKIPPWIARAFSWVKRGWTLATNLDSAVTFLGYLGIAKVLGSLLLAAAAAISATMEGLSPTIVACIALVFFAATLSAFNSVMAAFDRRRAEPPSRVNLAPDEPPLSPYWQHVDPLCLWQAACLWVDIEPYNLIHPGEPPYPVLEGLFRAAAAGEIKVNPGGVYLARHSKVQRSELLRWAASREMQTPKFLKG